MPVSLAVVVSRKPKLNHWMRKACLALTILSGLMWASAAPLCADTTTRQKSTQPAAHRSPSTTLNAARKAPTTSHKSSTQHAARRRVYSRAAKVAAARRRRAMLRPEPERIQQIQQALAKEGYLKADPTGIWDEATRDAMRRFQTDHGFPVTGLPEAKSLMKLGLGPHPLPSDLDTASGAPVGNAPVRDTPPATAAPPAAAPTATPDAQQNPPATTPQP